MTNAQLNEPAAKRPDVYQRITERMIDLLEAGTVPWRLPWKAEGPKNLISRRPYRGINAFLLNAMRYTSPYWLTFLQVQSLGGRIRRGERACPVVLWKWITVEKEEKEEEIPLLRQFSVFNVEQVDGLPALPALTPQPFAPIAEAERVVAQMPSRPSIRHGAGMAAYLPSEDAVLMPKPELFCRPEDYYSTLFHELTHASGHVSRLGRKEVVQVTGFGSDPYGREELVAEMGAAFLCGHCQMERQTLSQSAAYIHGWLKRIRAEPRMLIQAAAQAQKAADYILKRQDDAPAEHDTQPQALLAR